MKVLVANLGSTSFKYRLFDMETEAELARGGVERIGAQRSDAFVEIAGQRSELAVEAPDHAAAVEACLGQLTEPDRGCLKDASEVSAIGFKAVHGGRAGGVCRVDDGVLRAMEEMNPVAPAHNPPYIAAMRQLGEKLPEMPLVAAFETGFHETIPERLKTYAAPYHWATDYGVRRWGFHGASHRYVATRTAELLGRDDLRVVSCHLGGSSSVCAIRGGKSVATSMGMSPQTGLPQSSRVGDFDAFALLQVAERTGKSFEELLAELGSQGGLLGLSGVSGDLRDVRSAADGGNARAQLAIDVYVSSIRHYLGAYLVELGGIDVIAFAGGIGENGVDIRAAVCADLEGLGIEIDPAKNASQRGEGAVHAPASKTEIWVVPTNEELVVARQTKALLGN
ncbi:Acetate kinase [Pirellulimonas nuda]|uniref:Acetate kinase n=1 Tax=Pirellulimonas nuda TaxID=2528009 RepID=A0A518DGM4_9BACT|nr:acetate/propionate family kinase [Pirellulimonas nuda]QDU90630.1 Acetate kinase [Pirellulimonas nuda]